MTILPSSLVSLYLKGRWVSEVPGVGQVPGSTSYEHRGATAIFRLSPVRVVSADDLGLSPEVQALAFEPQGLVVVAGSRSSGKGNVIAAFVDLANRLRRDSTGLWSSACAEAISTSTRPIDTVAIVLPFAAFSSVMGSTRPFSIVRPEGLLFSYRATIGSIVQK